MKFFWLREEECAKVKKNLKIGIIYLYQDNCLSLQDWGLFLWAKKKIVTPLCVTILKKATVLLVNIFNLLSLSEVKMGVILYV